MPRGSRKWVALLAALLIIPLVAGCVTQTAAPAQKKDFVFGSSVDGSYGYLVLEAMSSVLNKHIEGTKFSSVSTSGGTENIALLFDNVIDGGHSNSTDIPMAYQGKAPYKQAYEPMQLVSYGALTQIIAVRANSGINSLSDLKGKRVVVGPIGSGLQTVLSQYFALAGIEIEPVHLAIPETADAFLSGRADAAALLFRNGEPYPLNMEIEAATDVRYLPWDPAVNKKMAAEGYTLTHISPDVSKYMTEPIEVFNASMILVVRPDLPEDLAYTITKTLVENEAELVKITPHLKMVGRDHVTTGLLSGVPVHPGAARFYKEAGIWEDRLVAGQ